MPIIKQAHQEDTAQILKILDGLDLYHPSRIPEDFWVADENGKIVGVSCLSEYNDFLFLSSVGVAQNKRHKGIARAMLKKIFSQAKKDIYLYTIIPEFFKKFGFAIAAAPENLPTREGLGCEDCLLPNCVCMRRMATYL